MLGKLLKHEFRATGRLMLPALGAVVILAVLANLSLRLIQVADSGFLTILLGLVIAAFVIGVIAVSVMTVVLMVLRFYRNLLKDEGYLMHTLPVSADELVWSKLIVSLVWFIVTGLVICLIMALSALIQSGTDLGEIFVQLPSLRELWDFLAEHGLRRGDLWLLGGEWLLASLLNALGTCLHFYAAMSLGHMFAKNKVLFSVLFFVGLSMVMSFLGTASGVGMMTLMENADLSTLAESVRTFRLFGLQMVAVSLVQGALLYFAAVLPLKKRLNLD